MSYQDITISPRYVLYNDRLTCTHDQQSNPSKRWALNGSFMFENIQHLELKKIYVRSVV